LHQQAALLLGDVVGQVQFIQRMLGIVA
jgi:hypothetical protein